MMSLSPLQTILRHALTRKDNSTYDLGKLGGFLALLALIIFQAFQLKDFNPINFSTGASAIIAAIVAADRWAETPAPIAPIPGAPTAVVSAEKVTIR